LLVQPPGRGSSHPPGAISQIHASTVALAVRILAIQSISDGLSRCRRDRCRQPSSASRLARPVDGQPARV
jgi:hypothetical protein